MHISFSEAIHRLKSGEVVAIPTETVYGLAACLEQTHAIEQVFALKKRPSENPLIVHIADQNQLDHYVDDLPPDFDRLANAFWPGPLTMILPCQPDRVPSIVRAGLPTTGFRMPQHSLTRELLRQTGPLVMPSANLSGRPSATCPEHVEEDFGSEFPVLDGGWCLKGVESTILYFQDPQWVVARLGALSPEDFQKVLGYQPSVMVKNTKEKPLCPGQLFRHYAPRAKLILIENNDFSSASFIIGFKEKKYPSHCQVLVFGSLNSPEEVAENLYRILRQLDGQNIQMAWIDMDFPRQGLWSTIAERLYRAGES